MSAFHALVDLVRRLRAEDGCPWDRAQTVASLRPYLQEEAYEVLAAMDDGSSDELNAELGDLLFTTALIAAVDEAAGGPGLEAAADRVIRKMVVRHPHVFAPATTDEHDPGAVASWEARKARERHGRGSALDGVPAALPALLRAHRISEKASRVGFDWPDVAGVRSKLDEELDELDAAIASGVPDAIGEELGDVLFTLVNLGRHLPVSAEDALRTAVDRFSSRFRRLEATLAAEGRTVHDEPADALERRWRAAKHPLPDAPRGD